MAGIVPHIATELLSVGPQLYCVDLAPAEYGTRGQVIAWEIHSGPSRLIASSLEDYLRRYRDRLTSSQRAGG